MIRTLNRVVIALVIIAFPMLTYTYASDARTEHTESFISTLASDSTTYQSGDAEAFNAVIAKLATESGPAIIAGDKVVPNITVSIFKGTGKAYVTESMTRKAMDKEFILSHVPPVPREVLSGQIPAFDFDWIVLQSATNNNQRRVSVALFTGGNVELFDCVMPKSVSLEIGKHISIAAKDGK